MSEVAYPKAWSRLASPSQRYELLLTLDDITAGRDSWNGTQVRGFLFDDISARERAGRIIGGCLLDEKEEAAYFVLLSAYEMAVAHQRMTDELLEAAAQLLELMRKGGLPTFA